MHAQKGLSLSGFVTWLIIFAILALIAFKLGPAYMDDFTIQKHFRILAKDSSLAAGTRPAVEYAYSKRADIDRIDVISPKDIVISKEGAGLSLSATYRKCVPMVYNISACMDFNPSSD